MGQSSRNLEKQPDKDKNSYDQDKLTWNWSSWSHELVEHFHSHVEEFVQAEDVLTDKEKQLLSRLVMSNSMQPHGLDSNLTRTSGAQSRKVPLKLYKFYL